MRIESEKIRLVPLNLVQIRMDGQIGGLYQATPLKLNAVQIEVVERMQKGDSLKEIAQSYFRAGVWPPYSKLKAMIEFMVHENIIQNESFRSYFSKEIEEPKSFFESLLEKMLGPTAPPIKIKEELEQLPFFRSVDAQVRQLFLEHCQIIQTPKGLAVCQEGLKQRSLLVLLDGQASVYKKNSAGKRNKLAVLTAGSVFGEVGFFLGEPRTADVVTDCESTILRIKYVPEIFDTMIRANRAREIQKRLWIIHALLKSEVFSGLPEDCFDALIFAGELKSLPPRQWICKEGEPGDACYILVQGSVAISQKGRKIGVLTQGDCFGEVALIMSRGIRTASVMTSTEILTLELKAQPFYELLSENFMLACEFEGVAVTRLHHDLARAKA